MIRVYDESGPVIETHEHAGEFKEPFFRASDETWRCDLCDDLFHGFDCVSASVEARGDNVRMESLKFDGHTQTNTDSVPFKVR